MQSGYALSSSFAPGDCHLFVGTKVLHTHPYLSSLYHLIYLLSFPSLPSLPPLPPPHTHLSPSLGELQLFEVPSGTLLESVSAHDGAVWSVCVAPDRQGCVTGSADHSVKFWEFEVVSEKEVKTR